jgi:phosphoglycerate dehydrogenase-like enzyme
VKPAAVFLADASTVDLVYGPDAVATVAERCRLIAPHVDVLDQDAVRAALGEAEIVLSSWGMPAMTPEVLRAAPQLRIIIYGAGSIKGFVTDEVFRRSITVTSAAAANGRVVAEYVVALMTMCLKDAWRFVRDPVSTIPYFARETALNGHGGFASTTVGIVSASAVGRAVIALLASYPCDVLLYDPYVSSDEAEAMGVRLAELDDLFRRAHIVSLHAPDLPELRGLVDARRLSLMRDGAWFINTARGALVDESALARELAAGRIGACLDVTNPEPPAESNPLLAMPNVVVTPHIAGAIGHDCRRLGALCMAELDRYLRGEPPLHAIGEGDLAVRA